MGNSTYTERTGKSICFHFSRLHSRRKSVVTINIAKGKKTIVTNDPSQRYYYLMVFNNRYRVRVAARNVNIPGIQNFRDLGGYKSAETGKDTAGECCTVPHRLTAFHSAPRRELKNMGIRTIIDLRSEEERHNYPQAS